MKIQEMIEHLEKGDKLYWHNRKYQVVLSKKYSIGLGLLDTKLNIEYPLKDAYHSKVKLMESIQNA